MHEMSIAVNIVDIICQKAEEEDASKINSVELKIGTLSGIMIESLEFCFEAACKNTLAEGSELKINNIEAKAKCKSCSILFLLESDFTPCPKCNSFDFTILSGRELSIKSFNID